MASLGGPNIITNGLVLALDAANVKSYPGSGTVWNDLSGNNNSGSLTNGPTFSSTNGGSIIFDGTNDYSTQLIALPNNNLTACVWIRNNDVSITQRIFAQGNFGSDSAGNNFSLQIFNSTVRGIIGSLGSGQFVGTGVSILSNTWTKVDLILGSGKLDLYINGVIKQSDITSSTIGISSYIINIATRANNASEFFSGIITNLQIYNRALSASEILQNYNAVRSRFGL
jgi:hypothetical protein